MQDIQPHLPAEAALASNAHNLRDVTARQRTEEQSAFHAHLLENLNDTVIAVDAQQRISLWNAAAERMYGYTAAEAIGQPVTMLVPEDGQLEVRALFERLARGQVVEPFEARRRRKDGRLVDVWVSLSPIRNAAGELIGAAACCRDIGERKQLEARLAAKSQELAAMNQQLWQAAKLATMGELAAGIAHELNNPLAIVSLRLEALRNSLEAADPRRKSVEIVEGELERMAQLVAELLQATRRSPQISTLDLRAEIAKALEFMHYHLKQRGIRVSQVVAPDVPFVQADRQLLRQVFLNLLTNAADAMPSGGDLVVCAATGPRAAGEAAVVLVDFQDTGVGITPAALARIWEPFFTTKPEGKGTGLGLPICRRILEEHGGSIEVASTVGQGTRVRLVVPVSRGASTLDREAVEASLWGRIEQAQG